MRATAIRRTAIAATAVSLALLATACGGSESGSDGKAAQGKETASARPTATAAAATKALTAVELEKLALADGDVKDHEVKKAGAEDITTADDMTVDKAECEPLAYAVSGVPVGEPAATVQRVVSSEAVKPSAEELAEMTDEEQLMAGFDVTMTMVSLSSYEAKGAEETVAALRTAAKDCAGGFTMTADGEKQKVSKLSDESVSGGEEALAWTVTAEQDGETAPLKVVIVRQGSTLASFSSMNLAAISSGEDYELPTAVVEAQVAKLG